MEADILLPIIKRRCEVFVTAGEFDRLFDAPKFIPPIQSLAFSLAGNRQPESQNDLLKLWIEMNNIEYRVDYITGNHHFRFKDSSLPPQ